jgi:serine/threonine protein kinase
MYQNLLNYICKENNLKPLDILHENKRKDSAVICVVDLNHQKKILKICGNNASQTVKDAFKNEIRFYDDFKSEFIMNLSKSGENFLLIEFFDGVTIRDFIKKKSKLEHNDVERILKESQQIFEWFFHPQKNDIANLKNDEVIVETLFDRIGNLATSGPKNTRKNGFESFLIRRAWNKSKKNLRKKISEYIKILKDNDVKLYSGMGHYDMHYDNLLINDQKIKLIDFGNFKNPGIWISDILYFYATINASLSNCTEYQKRIKLHTIDVLLSLDSTIDRKVIEKLINLFFATAEMNSRFRIRDNQIKIKRIFGFMKLISDL